MDSTQVSHGMTRVRTQPWTSSASCPRPRSKFPSTGSLVVTNRAELLMRLNAPALVAFVSSQQPQSTELLALLQRVRDEVHKRTPTDRSWAMPKLKLHEGRQCCNECSILQEFIESKEQRKTVTLAKYRQKHLRDAIDRWCRKLVTYRCDNKEMTLTKHHDPNDLYATGRHVLGLVDRVLGTPTS